MELIRYFEGPQRVEAYREPDHEDYWIVKQEHKCLINIAKGCTTQGNLFTRYEYNDGSFNLIWDNIHE